MAERPASAAGQHYVWQAGQFTQEDPIGLAGGLNLYGYGAGDPVNNADPFGLCPYEGAKRSMDVHDCRAGRLKSAAQSMLADGSGAGRKSLERIMQYGTSVYETPGRHLLCGGSNACFIAGLNAIFLNTEESLGDDRVGALFTHEGRHAGEDEGEAAAWNAALDFFDALPVSRKQDGLLLTYSALRQKNREEFIRFIKEEAQKENQKP